MKKFLILLLALLATLASCFPAPEPTPEDADSGPQGGYVFQATVESVGDRIAVSVTESEFGTGIYWVITAPETKYETAEGISLKREDLSIGDTVEIEFGGQVMMSYPPQIVAARITVLSFSENS